MTARAVASALTCLPLLAGTLVADETEPSDTRVATGGVISVTVPDFEQDGLRWVLIRTGSGPLPPELSSGDLGPRRSIGGELPLHIRKAQEAYRAEIERWKALGGLLPPGQTIALIGHPDADTLVDRDRIEPVVIIRQKTLLRYTGTDGVSHTVQAWAVSRRK